MTRQAKARTFFGSLLCAGWIALAALFCNPREEVIESTPPVSDPSTPTVTPIGVAPVVAWHPDAETAAYASLNSGKPVLLWFYEPGDHIIDADRRVLNSQFRAACKELFEPCRIPYTEDWSTYEIKKLPCDVLAGPVDQGGRIGLNQTIKHLFTEHK